MRTLNHALLLILLLQVEIDHVISMVAFLIIVLVYIVISESLSKGEKVGSGSARGVEPPSSRLWYASISNIFILGATWTIIECIDG